jgi:lipase
MALLHVERWGDGPPLLALHGVTGHARRWERLATEAWPHRHTIAVDLRGHGRSTWLPPWSTEQMVLDVLETMDAVGLADAAIVGNSYGATVALHLLAVAPERVRCIAALDPALQQAPQPLVDAAEAMIAEDGFATREQAAEARNVCGADGVHPAVLAELDHHLERGTDGRFRFRHSRPAAIAIFGELARPVPMIREPRPVLVLAAERPRIVTASVSAGLRAMLGDAYQEVALDCGHLLYWERFDETAALVEAFLAADQSRVVFPS